MYTEGIFKTFKPGNEGAASSSPRGGHHPAARGKKEAGGQGTPGTEPGSRGGGRGAHAGAREAPAGGTFCK